MPIFQTRVKIYWDLSARTHWMSWLAMETIFFKRIKSNNRKTFRKMAQWTTIYSIERKLICLSSTRLLKKSTPHSTVIKMNYCIKINSLIKFQTQLISLLAKNLSKGLNLNLSGAKARQPSNSQIARALKKMIKKRKEMIWMFWHHLGTSVISTFSTLQVSSRCQTSLQKSTNLKALPKLKTRIWWKSNTISA